MEAARPATLFRGWRKGGHPWRPWAGGRGGPGPWREDLVAQAQGVKMVTANTTATSDLVTDGGHARWRRALSVRATPRVMVALKRSRCQTAEVLEQLVKKCRLRKASRSGKQVREPSPSDVCWPGHPGGHGAGRSGGRPPRPPGRDPPASARCDAKAGPA